MYHSCESEQREEKDMTMISTTNEVTGVTTIKCQAEDLNKFDSVIDRVTGVTTTKYRTGNRTVIVRGNAVSDLKPVMSDDGKVQFVRTPRRGKKTNVGLNRRFFWRVRARFGADWSRMTEAQIAFEMRMVSNRRAV
jgi:hypothetical protein